MLVVFAIAVPVVAGLVRQRGGHDKAQAQGSGSSQHAGSPGEVRNAAKLRARGREVKRVVALWLLTFEGRESHCNTDILYEFRA